MKNSKTRRKFIKNSLILGIGAPIIGSTLQSCMSETNEADSGAKSGAKKLRILILGGTSFLGPHQIAYAISRGHSITTFTRGKTLPTIHVNLFKEVEQLIGDRNDDLTALENRIWDVVIDNSGRDVEWTKKSAALLKENADLYIYTSSTGVFYPYVGSDMKEDSEVLLVEPENAEGEEKMEYWYGVMKSNSEIETIKAFGKERSIIIRPTYMMGPGDKTDRFIHWPVRLSRGGELMVPGKKGDPVQYIDVRDVAEWMIRLAEEKSIGTFNVVGPPSVQSMHAFVNEAKDSFDVESTLVYIDDYEFLKANNIPYLIPWIMPEGNNYGSARINNNKARKAGLTFRDLKQSIRETNEWWTSDALSAERRNKFELDPATVLVREKTIIENWQKFKG